MGDRDRSPIRVTTTCEVCHIEACKYTCPHCRVKYCSVACFKTHRSGENCIPTKEEVCSIVTEESPVEKDLDLEDDDRVATEKLQLLDKSKDVARALGNPHLRKMLEALDEARDPAAAIHQAMLEPIFVEFVDACLQTVEPNDPRRWPGES